LSLRLSNSLVLFFLFFLPIQDLPFLLRAFLVHFSLLRKLTPFRTFAGFVQYGPFLLKARRATSSLYKEDSVLLLFLGQLSFFFSLLHCARQLVKVLS